MSVQKSIYLISAAGSPNFGDELITLAWIKRLRSERPHDRIVVDCHNPGFFNLLIGRYSWGAGVVVTDLCWRAARRAGTHGVYDGMKAQRPLLYSERSNAYDDIKWGLSSFDGEFEIVHLLGGGYISDKWPANLLLVMVAEWIASVKNARLVATGAGIYVSNFPLLFDVADPWRAFDYISVRDPASQNYLSKIGIQSELEPDDVVLCLPSEVPSSGNIGMAVNLQLDQFTSADYAATTMELISRVRDYNGLVYLLDLYPNVDTEFTLRAVAAVDEAKVVAVEAVLDSVINEEWDAPFRGHGIEAVGTRYHFHYIWSWLGSSGAYLSADDYYTIKHTEVVSLGSNWRRFPERGGVPQVDRKSLTKRKYAEFRSLYRVEA